MPLNKSFMVHFEFTTCYPIPWCIEHLKSIVDNFGEAA